jgi:hypothetical protein
MFLRGRGSGLTGVAVFDEARLAVLRVQCEERCFKTDPGDPHARWNAQVGPDASRTLRCLGEIAELSRKLVRGRQEVEAGPPSSSSLA